LDDVDHPIVLAPLAGGPSTPELTAAVASTGGLAFLAAGYLSPDALRQRMAAVRTMTDRPFGVNLFVPGRPSDPRTVEEYAELIRPEAERLGVALGEARFDDDSWDEKLAVLEADPVAVVSFTFGCPPADVIDRLRGRGTEVWVTVTTPEEGAAAVAAGADGVVAQGIEAGGHRGTWTDEDPRAAGYGLLALVQHLRSASDRTIVAAGGLGTAGAIGGALLAGADAVALGTAFLQCPEAGTADVHRAALRGSAPTALTRAFSGRWARGIRNRMLDTYSSSAPSAYPEINTLTGPLRQAGREQRDGDVVNLWAGQAYQLAKELPAAVVVNRLLGQLDAIAPPW
jgi:nitronate monooxygenase